MASKRTDTAGSALPHCKKFVTEAEFKKCIREVNIVVGKHARGSTLRGLDITAAAFACLLDFYANPNPVNPLGMCDDPRAFRRMYAEFIATAPSAERLQEPTTPAQ